MQLSRFWKPANVAIYALFVRKFNIHWIQSAYLMHSISCLRVDNMDFTGFYQNTIWWLYCVSAFYISVEVGADIKNFTFYYQIFHWWILSPHLNFLMMLSFCNNMSSSIIVCHLLPSYVILRHLISSISISCHNFL